MIIIMKCTSGSPSKKMVQHLTNTGSWSEEHCYSYHWMHRVHTLWYFFCWHINWMSLRLSSPSLTRVVGCFMYVGAGYRSNIICGTCNAHIGQITKLTIIPRPLVQNHKIIFSIHTLAIVSKLWRSYLHMYAINIVIWGNLEYLLGILQFPRVIKDEWVRVCEQRQTSGHTCPVNIRRFKTMLG